MSRAIAAGREVGQDYFDLVLQFPLRPLRGKGEYEAALAQLDGLVGRHDLSPGAEDYIDALTCFVEAYEAKRYAGTLAKFTPVELLRFLMEENGMKTVDLGYVLGSRGLASQVLSGKRGLSQRLILRLAERFHVSPAMFMEGGGGREG